MKKPKFNKLITLLLLLGTFAFIMEAENRVSTFAKEELSRWASLLPVKTPSPRIESLNPYAHQVSLLDVLQTDSIKNQDSVVY